MHNKNFKNIKKAHKKLGGGKEGVLTKWNLKVDSIENKGLQSNPEWKRETFTSGVDQKTVIASNTLTIGIFNDFTFIISPAFPLNTIT